MFRAIEGARQSVYLEMYIFSDKIDSFDFLSLLEKKAKSGVRVRIVLDSLGSVEFGPAADSLRESGAEVLFFNNLLHRMHMKILIVDEAVAFLGGVNFHNESRRWNDLSVEMRGGLVRSVMRTFAKAYALSGGTDPAILAKNKTVFIDKTRTGLIEHFPIENNHAMKRVYRKFIGKAEKNIILVTPYFMPKRWFIRLLRGAVERGVRVEVLVPGTTEHFFVDRVGYFFMYKISSFGVKVYTQSRMNHAKLMIIDSKDAIVGSNNLDFLSFELNSEVGIFFKEPDSVRKIMDIVNNWKRDAVLFDPATHNKPKIFDPILSPLIRMSCTTI